MRIALIGYGKMGKTIEKLATLRGHTIGFKTNEFSGSRDLSNVDVAIEFSEPGSAYRNIERCIKNGIPVVSGTTGWLSRYNEMVKFCENRNGSFIYASNFSIGVNLFFKINEFVSKLMNDHNDYIISIEEIHHIEKKDAPSGTAISLAEKIIKNTDNEGWVSEPSQKNKITIHSKRIKEVKGTHIVKYDSEIDSISIKHQAHTRDGFALGALIAAEWLIGKKGVYSMNDVLKL
jgi:4-hydroxy-tetrahydrodipicolinate reductase